VRLVSPGADGQIDIGALQGRGYIDVTFTVSVPGYKLDVASITDLAAEFTLSGAGLGTIKLDGGQAPVRLDSGSGPNYTFRYWTTGEFAADAGTADTVTLELTAGGWSYLADTHPLPSGDHGVATNGLWLTVNFDNVPAGYRIDPASITDLAPEFTLTYTGQNVAKNGTGTIALVAICAEPHRRDQQLPLPRVGNFAADGTQSVTLGVQRGQQGLVLRERRDRRASHRWVRIGRSARPWTRRSWRWPVELHRHRAHAFGQGDRRRALTRSPDLNIPAGPGASR
jgi:hypothetical protein